jgi:hypothetical protein
MTETADSVTRPAPAEARDEGHEALPRPTYAPAAMALGIAFLFWGMVTSVVVLGAGGLLVIAALAAWIGEMRHEP